MNTKKVTKVQQHARARGTGGAKRVPAPKPRKRSVGQRAVYTAELRDRICDLITDGASWRDIEKMGLASQRTLATWLRTRPDFSSAYLWAREARAETLMGEIEELLKDLGTVEDHVALHAVKLKIDTLKWQVSCFYPRVYGTRTIVETETSRPVDVYDYSRLTDAEIKTLLALMEKALVSPPDES